MRKQLGTCSRAVENVRCIISRVPAAMAATATKTPPRMPPCSPRRSQAGAGAMGARRRDGWSRTGATLMDLRAGRCTGGVTAGRRNLHSATNGGKFHVPLTPAFSQLRRSMTLPGTSSRTRRSPRRQRADRRPAARNHAVPSFGIRTRGVAETYAHECFMTRLRRRREDPIDLPHQIYRPADRRGLLLSLLVALAKGTNAPSPQPM